MQIFTFCFFKIYLNVLFVFNSFSNLICLFIYSLSSLILLSISFIKEAKLFGESLNFIPILAIFSNNSFLKSLKSFRLICLIFFLFLSCRYKSSFIKSIAKFKFFSFSWYVLPFIFLFYIGFSFKSSIFIYSSTNLFIYCINLINDSFVAYWI